MEISCENVCRKGWCETLSLKKFSRTKGWRINWRSDKKALERKGMTPRLFDLDSRSSRERERESKVWQGRVNGVILIKILCPFDFLLHSIIIDDERNFNLQTVIKIWIGTLINCCKDRLDSLKRERIISPISSKSQLKLQLTLFPERWILA